MKQKNNRGFTLVELLVVITVMAILAGFTIAAIIYVTGRARDARRKGDLNAIKKALYLARSDTLNAAFFPQCNNSIGNGCILTDSQNTIPSIAPNYLRTLPTDPKTHTGYHYYPRPSGPSQCNNQSQNPCTSYQLIACIEYTTDPQAVADSTECPNTGFKYVLTND